MNTDIPPVLSSSERFRLHLFKTWVLQETDYLNRIATPARLAK